MASKAKNIPQRCTFFGGSGERDMVLPEEELSSLKHHSLSLRPLLHKSTIVIFRQQFEMFDPNNFTLSSMLLFQNAWHTLEKLCIL